jgi:hypothetical protein
MCSKHVEAWNKLIVKQKFCASSWLIIEMNILSCTVNKTSKFQERVDLCGVKKDVDSRQRTLLISIADLSFPEYSKIADKSPNPLKKDLFCSSDVSRCRTLTLFWYLHGSNFRDTHKGYLRVKGESKANPFCEMYFRLLDRQDKLLHMTPRIVMTPHWNHVYTCTRAIYITFLHFWTIFLELLKFPGEGKNCYLPIFSICRHGYDF